MKNYLALFAACASVALACQKDAEPRAAETNTVPDGGRPTQLIFPEAARAEGLLRSAGIPIVDRPELIRPFPEGCVWQAVYASERPEVILEAYAFENDVRAREYGSQRNAELRAMDVLREFAVATNGPLLLVAYYDPTQDAAAKKAALEKFVAAFSEEE